MPKLDEHLCLGHRQHKRFPVLALVFLYAGYAPASNLDVPPAPSAAPIPRLKGIGGVGGRLSAIVTADGHDTIYHDGLVAPFAGRDPGLRLVRIASPYADFLDTRNRSLAICVNGVHK